MLRAGVLLAAVAAADAQCSCCGVAVACPCLPICFCKCDQGPPPPAPPAPVPPPPPKPKHTYLCILYQGKQQCEAAPSSAGGKPKEECEKECAAPVPPPASTYLCIFYQGKQQCQAAPGGKPLADCQAECSAPAPPTPPAPTPPSTSYLCIFYQGKQQCQAAPGGKPLADCQAECSAPAPPTPPAPTPPAASYLCIFYQGKQQCQAAPGGKPLADCQAECSAPAPPTPPAPPPAPTPPAQDAYLCILYQGKQQCYPAPPGTAGALPKAECEKQCAGTADVAAECYACVMPSTGCIAVDCAQPGAYPSKAACAGACPVPTPPSPPSPPAPATRYHCDPATYTCAAASEGHSSVAKCQAACAAPPPTPPSPPGPLKVVTKTISFTGKPCSASLNGTALGDTSFKASVTYPKDTSVKYPVVSFAHGATVSDAHGAYSGTIDGVAARGYVVVAFNGCPTTMYAWHPQVSAIEWLVAGKEPSLAHVVDTTAKTGVFGHSMGGAATVCAASDSDSVQSANIAAAIAMHPGISTGPTKPIVPILYFSGSADSIVAPALVKSKYNGCPHTVDRGLAEFKGYTHFSPTEGGSNKEIKWIADLFDCNIRKDSSACDKVFGTGKDSLCGAGETTACETHKAGQ